jgi:hypothetical protein
MLEPEPRSWLQDTEFWIQDSEYWIQHPCSCIQGPGLSIQDAKCTNHDLGLALKDPALYIQDLESWIWGPGSPSRIQIQDPSSRILAQDPVC